MIGGLGTGWDWQAEQAQLNAMGEQGWELVTTIIKTTDGQPVTYHYFRREKPEHDDRSEGAHAPHGSQAQGSGRS